MSASVTAVPQPAVPVVLPTSSSPSQPTQDKAPHKPAGNVQQEQNFVRAKSKSISNFFRGVKGGEVKATVPTNNQVESVLTSGANNIDKFQNSERGAKLTEQNQKVLTDIKELLVQENAIILERNDQEQLQNFMKSGAVVAKDIGNNPVVQEIIQKWKTEISNAMRNKDWKSMAKLGDDVISTLRQAEAFVEFTVELGKIAKILNNKLGKERALVVEERDAVLRELLSAIKVMSANSLWQQAIALRDPLDPQKRADLKSLQGAFDPAHLQKLTESGQALLQAIVGDAVSVQPFTEAIVNSIRYIYNEQQLFTVVRDAQDLLTQISSNPALTEDPLTQASMKLMLEKLEFAITSILRNEHVTRARAEGDKLVRVIKSDPMNKKLIEGLQTLRTDANPAEIMSGLRTFIVPLIIDHLNNIPLSTIKTTKNIFGLGVTEVEISDLRLSLRDFLPQNLRMKLEYEFNGNPQDMTVSEQKLVAKIDIKRLHINVRDASWKYTRKDGAGDQGKASFRTLGKGISLSLTVTVNPNGNDKKEDKPIITVDHAKCKMDKFSLEFAESKRDKFYSFMASVSSRKIRNELQKTVANAMKDMAPTIEAKVTELFGISKVKVQQMSQQRKDKKAAKEAKKAAKKEAKKQKLAVESETVKEKVLDEVAGPSEASGAEVPTAPVEEKKMVIEPIVDLTKDREVLGVMMQQQQPIPVAVGAAQQ